MPWARASELDRVMACPASTHLVRIGRPPGDAANWGNLVHSWKESGVWPEDTLATRRRQAALVGADLTREALYPPTGLHEVSFALHTANRIVTSYVSKDRDEREAWKASFDSGWLTGTCDYVGEILDEPWVCDLKTGRQVPENPWDLWQLRYYAVCAALAGHSSVVHVSVCHWPRYPADGIPHRYWTPEPIQRAELLGVTLPLLEMKRREVVASWDRTDARPGDHCTWCDSSHGCPAVQARV